MLNNQIEQIRECYQHALECAQQADVELNPNVKKQFLELQRRWELLAHSCEDR